MGTDARRRRRALWLCRNDARARLVAATRERRRSSSAVVAPTTLRSQRPTGSFDPDALTIGFVGRFVAYKRPTLFLRDPDRLERLLTDPEQPVQIVFAGKAHPRDEHGKQLLQTVADFAHARGVSHRLVFIEDFDLTADRALSQGVDLWLNTPRRPLEACGIGGMKAGVNGALNLSTLDGWWDEVWHDAIPGAPPIGWSIGTADSFEDHELQDAVDAESLYYQLEHDVIPRFFERDDDGIPRRWLASVRQSMATLAATWRSHRMVHQYVDDFYVPGAARADRLAADDALRATRLAAAIDRIERAWPRVEVHLTDVRRQDDTVTIDILVRLGELVARDLTVDLWIEPRSAAPYPVAARKVGEANAAGGTVAYQATVHVGGPEAEFAARVLPVLEDAPSRFLPGLIAWSS